MNRTEFSFLQAEKNSLLQLIEETPKNAVITLGSLQDRLEEVDSLLEKYATHRLPVEGRITFRGKPVLGSEGIESAFAAKTLGNFSSMIAAKASSYQGTLSSSGKIANRDAYRMNITGTTIGSFGFIFEECPSDQPASNEFHSPVESALIDCIEFFNVLQSNDEEELANVIDRTDNRVLGFIRTFLDDLIAHEAFCAFESGRHSFRFKALSEVLSFSQRIKEENIREWPETYEGELIGVLVSERKFDFRLKEDGEPLLKGKISTEVGDLEEINRNCLFKRVRIHALAKQIGTGPFRYTLLRFDPME